MELEDIFEDKRWLLLLFDLFFLRYGKGGKPWYELTDYLRDKLKEDGILVSYDDKNKDLIFGVYKPHISLKRMFKLESLCDNTEL